MSITVVTELSPPNQVMLGTKVAGIATEKVRSILNRANISSTFYMYPWARAYDFAKQDKNTLIYSIAKTDERQKLFHWLTPITEYKFGLVALSEKKLGKLNNVNQLSQYILAVQRDDIAHEWVIAQGLKEHQHFIVSPDIEHSWKLLLNKKVDFIVESPELMLNMLKKYNLPADTTEYILPIPALALTGYLAANKNMDPQILERLRSAIQQ